MVAARASFLDAGHYLPIAQQLAKLVQSYVPTPAFVFEAGAGTGYYTSHLLSVLPASFGIAVDLSKFAIRRAAKAHPRLDAVLADVLHSLPIADHSVDVALNVFAPRPAEELHRVLGPGGRLVVVSPQSDHLAEIRATLNMIGIHADKESKIARALHPRFTRIDQTTLRWRMQLNHHDLRALVQMGPSARHLPADILMQSLARQPTILSVTAAVNIAVYGPIF